MEWKLDKTYEAVRELRTLKPSLVEWKLSPVIVGADAESFLETFLSGMETGVFSLYLVRRVGP